MEGLGIKEGVLVGLIVRREVEGVGPEGVHAGIEGWSNSAGDEGVGGAKRVLESGVGEGEKFGTLVR